MAYSQTIVGVFITADRDVLLWVLLMLFFLAVAATALFARLRTWAEMVWIFVLVYAMGLGGSHLLFKWIVGVPFLKLELISITTSP